MRAEKIVDIYANGTNNVSVQTNRIDTNNILKRMVFFVAKKYDNIDTLY